ncbi:Eco57I restriction-modification methylase domain-containing protein [Thermogemmatispora sp.]|uniref:Eco57I restriction-modification methylase domain-containing protein n=1 Tax=Thermogemmatispora sp. TaxID=1968838 RepID=UPI001DA499A5|nr:TaqI-like C-terminal specificity domain-containing protein [Thermogemmatispora sp.]MBX5449603.1 N-6 DNA methylase [Thermogemmatispora sp.]
MLQGLSQSLFEPGPGGESSALLSTIALMASLSAEDAERSAAEEALLRAAMEWRLWLSTALVRCNVTLTPEDLDRAALLLLARLLFLRLCEERGLEPAGSLRQLSEQRQIYRRLQRRFQTAARRYVSSLFCLRPPATRHTVARGEPSSCQLLTEERLTTLTVDDETLRRLLQALYPPTAPCDFSRLSPSALGRLYEHFLEKTLTTDASGHLVLSEERTAKKADGIYYTPPPIVDYILAHSVAALLEREGEFARAARLRVLDPCCGAGSFLIRLYRLLLAWFREQYVAAGPERFPQAVRRDEQGRWRLTLAEGRRILLDQIYGVDLDCWAVEVTRLSLFLLLLEECQGSWHERAQISRLLPRLGRNIRCGNALGGASAPMPEAATLAKLAPFDWQAAFPQVFKRSAQQEAGGFDAVIGNPPYLFGEQRPRLARPYLEAAFTLARRQYDACWLFIEQGLKLTRPGGRFAFVVPDALLARDEARQARATLLHEGLLRVYHCGPVFRACVSAAVLVVERGAQPSMIACDVPALVSTSASSSPGLPVQTRALCSRRRFLEDSRHRLLVHVSDEEAALLARLEHEGEPLGQYVRISRGEEIGKRHVSPIGPLPILAGDNVTRYYIAPPTRFVSALTKPSSFYQAPKIVVVKTGRRCVAALETAGLATMQSLYNLHLLDERLAYETLLAILNSRLIDYYLYKTFTAYKRLFPQLNQTTLATIPLPPRLARYQEPLIRAARTMMALQTQLTTASSAEARQALEQQRLQLEAEINALVFRLYGLSEAETRMLESTV